MRDFYKPNRSAAVSANGMAATSHPASTLAALDVLRAGGNAMDAAVAACAVQCVVEPGSTGIGGDCFALYSKKGSSDIVAYNGSGRAPAAATAEWYNSRGFTEIPRQSPHAATVPGAVNAWETLIRDHGTQSLGSLLQPAINYARNGYAITPRVAHDFKSGEALLGATEAGRTIYLKDGKAPKLGEIHSQPLLAATMEAIAKDGAKAFYQGPIAADSVSFLQSLGGLHTEADFAEANGEYVKPIKTSFRGHDIYECPPNGQGIIALMILNILSGFEAKGDPLSPERLHIEIEATRLAYSVRDAYLADPAKADVPVEWLLSKELADQLRAQIDLSRPIEKLPAFAPPKHADTVYICVVDKDRNAVSFINSLFAGFGSGLVSPKTGIVFHNRAQSFVLKPDHPNVIAPRKRPLHTIIPGMAVKDGKAVMPFGVMGGHYQAIGHAHLISKIFDYGLDPQSAIDLPRVFPRPGADSVDIEPTLPADTQAALEKRGFRLGPPPTPIGGAQAIRIDWENGTLTGGSDPRKDGCALGY